jgi:uncharacterized protein YeaO (DUF488 family)
MKSKFFLAVFMCAVTLIGVGFNGSNDLIQWQANRLLKWPDFKGTAPQNSEHAAQTNSGISLDLQGTNNSFSISVTAHFDKQKSWAQRASESDYLLNHEQLHFNITELFARKLRKKIMYGKWTRSDELNKAIQPLYDANKNDWKAFQAKYDKETNHSLNHEAQELWNGMVSDSLKAYDRFRGQTVTINF